MTRYKLTGVTGLFAILTSLSPVIRADDDDFTTISTLASTIPTNGDVNP